MEQRTIAVEFEGLWRRNYISRSNGTIDKTTAVWWFQSSSYHIDLRVPQDCQEHHKITGFAGITVLTDGSRCEWQPEIAFPVREDSVDAGFMRFEGDLLYETGVDGTYEEEWYRVMNQNMTSYRSVDLESGVVTYMIEGDQWKAIARGNKTDSYFGNESDTSKWTEISVFEKDVSTGDWIRAASTIP